MLLRSLAAVFVNVLLHHNRVDPVEGSQWPHTNFPRQRANFDLAKNLQIAELTNAERLLSIHNINDFIVKLNRHLLMFHCNMFLYIQGWGSRSQFSEALYHDLITMMFDMAFIVSAVMSFWCRRVEAEED